MPAYLSRICWNDHGWVQPSGTERERGTYLDEFGFGHEEWLFKYDWLIDGWKYGFLQPINRSLAKVEGQRLDLFLYTLHPRNGWFYVANLRDCEVLTAAQAEMARAECDRTGELARMKEQVRAIHGDVRGLEYENARGLFNIRFRPTPHYEPRPVPPGAALRKYRRYNLVEVSGDVREAVAGWPSRTGVTTVGSVDPQSRAGSGPTYASRLHAQLQQLLHDRLRDRFGADRVTMEADFVDIRFKDQSGALHLFEIKAESVARRAIRSALGQLMAYQHHASLKGERVGALIVAAPAELDETAASFLAFLGERLGTPVRYLCLRHDDPGLAGFVASLN